MNHSVKTIHWARLLHLLLGAGVVLYVFSRFIPTASLNDYPMYDSVENGWTEALHVAFVQHLQFGKDIVFTYGPWGFLARGYHPQTYAVSWFAWLILSSVFLCAGWRLAGHFSKNRLVAGLWLVGFTAAASIPVGDDFNTRLVAWNLLLLFGHFFTEEGDFNFTQILLVVSLGWLDLIKFTGLLETAVVLGVMALDNIFRQRRLPWIIPVWVASLVFFWVAAGQHLNLFGLFLINSWRITAGYTEAMMLTGKTETYGILWFLLIAGLMSLLVGKLAWQRHRYSGLLPVVGLATILFMAFKLGYVRNGWQHESTSALALVLVSLVILAVSWSFEKTLAMAATGLLIVTVVFAIGVFNFWFPGNGLGRQLASTFSLHHLFAPVAAPSTGYLRDEYAKYLTDERRSAPLWPIQGSTDLYSYDQTVLFAHGLAYQPRPVIQSYSAYTPELAAMNAAYLRTTSAPANLLFAIEPIDGRFPALDDGRSWPELLTLYDLQASSNSSENFLSLKRAIVPRNYHLIPLQVASVRFGECVPVPASAQGPIWVELTIQKTLVGRLASLLYKPPMLLLTVTLKNHTQLRYRLIPGMAAGGFLLSPLIIDNHSFVALAVTGAGPEVATMTISANAETGATASYRTSLEVRFYQLDYPLQRFKSH